MIEKKLCDGDDCGAPIEVRNGRRVDAGTDSPHTCAAAPNWVRAWVRMVQGASQPSTQEREAAQDRETDEELRRSGALVVSGDLNITISRSALSAVFADAIAYRTNSGEGSDSEDDETAARQFIALAERHGITYD